MWQEEGAFCVARLAVFPSLPHPLPPTPLNFPLFISVAGACLLGGMGAHGWVVRFCQPSVQSPSGRQAVNCDEFVGRRYRRVNLTMKPIETSHNLKEHFEYCHFQEKTQFQSDLLLKKKNKTCKLKNFYMWLLRLH